MKPLLIGATLVLGMVSSNIASAETRFKVVDAERPDG